MFKYNKILKSIALFAMLAGSNIATAEASATALFADAAGFQPAMDKQDPSFVTRSRYVSVNTSSLFDATGTARDASALPEVALNLFPNASFIGMVTQVQKTSDTTTWIGTLKNTPQGYFYLVVADGAFIAHVGSPQGIFEVSSAGNNQYKVIQLDQTKLGDDAPGAMAEPGPVLTKADIGTNADTAAVIDVMVVYTTAARTAEGSAAAMKARVALAVAETNQAYANAGVTPRLRLVHTEELPYTESGDIQTDVNRLTATADGYMDGVHALRNTYGADMVSLIVENGGGYCGIAKAIMATAATAFDVTARNGCMTGYYSFGHEFGHLQGARHDTYVDPTNTPYAYGHGYTKPSAGWRTVMAYNNACSAVGVNCTRLQYFSNPTKTYSTAPMGVTGVSENYKVLNTTALTVANFRTAKIGTDFSSQFSGSSTGWTPVKGIWATNTSQYYTTGLAGYFSSSKHANIYGDITFQASMKRTGCTTCANNLTIRGNAASLSAIYNWIPSYIFQYSNTGYFSVWKETAAGETALKAWTTSTAIIQGGWNTLKVVAVGPTLKFYINGVLVWTGSDAAYKTGTVGVGMYRDTTSTGNAFYVDWATLQTTPTAADTKNDEVVATGVTVSGGNMSQAPSAAFNK